MKPKTKIEFEVVRMSTYLPPITQKQIDWAYKHCIEHIGRVTKKGITCLDCLHTWDYKPIFLAKLDRCTCPNCGKKLKVHETRKRVFKDGAYYGITTTHKGFQLFRLCIVDVKYYSDKLPEYSCHEVAQRWISKEGKSFVLSVPRYANYGYTEIWQWWGDMELRADNHRSYSISPYKTYPVIRYIPEIKRNGYTGNFYGINRYYFYSLILRSNEAETLLKCGEIEWLKFFSDDTITLKKCWPALRVVLRHKLKIKDKHLWKDYICLLAHFGKDIRNPKVICPQDINKEHDRYVKKKRKQDTLLAKEKQIKKIAEEEEAYAKAKGQYFGIEFTDGTIVVKVLSSVLAVMEEGDALHHCVYTNKYYKDPDNILLSASINGKRLETIQISIKRKEVIQCRGAYNENTEYHNRIIEFVNKNINIIQAQNGRKEKQ